MVDGVNGQDGNRGGSAHPDGQPSERKEKLTPSGAITGASSKEAARGQPSPTAMQAEIVGLLLSALASDAGFDAVQTESRTNRA